MKVLQQRRELRIALLAALLFVLCGYWIARPNRIVGPPLKESILKDADFVKVDGFVLTKYGGGGLFLGLDSAPIARRERYIVEVPVRFEEEGSIKQSRNSFSALLATVQKPVDTSWVFLRRGILIQVITFLLIFASVRIVLRHKQGF